MIRTIMKGFIGLVIIGSLGCAPRGRMQQLVDYPPGSDAGSNRYYVTVQSERLGSQTEEVFVTIYDTLGQIYALREYEMPVHVGQRLSWEVTWNSLRSLKITFNTYDRVLEPNPCCDNALMVVKEPHRVFNLLMTYDYDKGTFVETPCSDVPVPKWKT